MTEKNIEHNPNQDEKNPCNGCTKCCEYVALEIDEPETKEDFDEIRWFLTHKDVWIFIDHDDSWNIQFNTPCEKIGENGWCEIYEKRPHICGAHSSENCDQYGEGDSFETCWKTIEEFEEWLKENKPDMVNF
jgi:Fe-S-cluster containining protein